MQVTELPPSPANLVESIRDLGYTLSTALADIIDNSLSARARSIQVLADVGGSTPRLGVVDDGEGMGRADLVEAMRLGSRNPLMERSRSDLGRFGLGLKTASFSQCRSLTVVSRRNNETACARWDLDRITAENRWLVETSEDTTALPWIDRLESNGTLVLWEKLGAASGGISQRNDADLIRQLDEARADLELIFHRFLEGEPGRPKVSISLNNRPLHPFDPFHSKHSATISGPSELIQVSGVPIRIQPYTLPHHSRVTPEEWGRYAGPEGYVRNQGFYVYRERRLIIHGTWFNLARQTELGKLARVRIDIPNSLDAAWKIDVRKASAQLPNVVRERLRRIIEPLVAGSRRVYTERGRRRVEENRLPVWVRYLDKGLIDYRINTEHPSIRALHTRLAPEMQGDFLRVLELAAASLPTEALFADMGGSDTSVVPTASMEALQYAVTTTLAHIVDMGQSREEALEMMRAAEPFRSNWAETERIIMRI